MRDVKFLSFESAIRKRTCPLGILDLMTYVDPSDETRLNICTLVFKKAYASMMCLHSDPVQVSRRSCMISQPFTVRGEPPLH